MTPADVLAALTKTGCRIAVEGDALRVRGPLTDDLRQAIREHKAALMRLLRPAPDLPPPVCDRCGGALFWQSVAYGPWTCARCYPPDTWRIVARWSSQEAGRGFEEVH